MIEHLAPTDDPRPDRRGRVATARLGPARPHLTLIRGGRADLPAPFVVAPPALLRLDRAATAAEIDMLRCRRLHPAAR